MKLHIFSGLYKKRSIKTPKGINTRPTTGIVRQAVFNILQNQIEGMSFLDLFAGSGAMGLEALSRGAKYSVFVENEKNAFKCIEENIEHLGVASNTKVLRLNVLAALNNLGNSKSSFDCIYADPPYMQMNEGVLISHQVVEAISKNALLKKGGILFIEEDKGARLEEYHYEGLKFVEKRAFGKSVLYIFKNP